MDLIVLKISIQQISLNFKIKSIRDDFFIAKIKIIIKLTDVLRHKTRGNTSSCLRQEWVGGGTTSIVEEEDDRSKQFPPPTLHPFTPT